MIEKFSKNLIDDIYEESVIDNNFSFYYLSSYAIEDEKYFFESKFDGMIFEQTIKLISFLVKTGDFELGQMKNSKRNILEFKRYENMKEFEKKRDSTWMLKVSDVMPCHGN
jgi:hypothetical protein